jgi:hypothetical protein
MGPCAEFCIYHLIPLPEGAENARCLDDESSDSGNGLFTWKTTMIGDGDKTFVPPTSILQPLPPRTTTQLSQNFKTTSTLTGLNFTTPKTLQDIAPVIRSKNSGPYEITIDVIFSSSAVFNIIKSGNLLTTRLVSDLYHLPEEEIIWCGFYEQALAWKCTIPRRRAVVENGMESSKKKLINASSGGYMESDVHASQQYVGFLSLELSEDVKGKIMALGLNA